MRTEIVKERTYYSPTFFKDDDGKCTLLTRHYQWRQGKRLRLHATSDAVVFPTEQALATSLLGLPKWRELPEEADGNPQFVPEEFRL